MHSEKVVNVFKLTDKLRNIAGFIQISLLILFVSYTCSITFFSHTHVVNGVTVIHSHSHKKNTKNQHENHEHNTSQFEIISFLSHFATSGDLPHLNIEEPSGLWVDAFHPVYRAIFYSSEYSGHFFLRGPPRLV